MFNTKSKVGSEESLVSENKIIIEKNKLRYKKCCEYLIHLVCEKIKNHMYAGRIEKIIA